ncbi:small glutamine-rich tetratricopeptide repeat-containing protein beta [Drosophila simulans]|uniref:small glutamine-rich tetratricopeptide repeat-containing protein beta n=1 Tax=Drosophila simulans TaxID=7240 RepID=UPI00192CED5A|nr:small glutamine-rich tetratricopeptide repeat-containing protein beta [Drosophila simulans]
MPDAVQQSFVRSFIDYLKKQVDVMSPDQSESIEVAIQCLQAAFDLGDDVEAAPDAAAQEQATTQSSSTASAPDDDAVASGSAGAVAAVPNNIDMFELFQSLYTERNPESLALAESIKNEGNRLMKENKYNEALLQYNRAIAFDPKNPIFYCNRAAAHIRLGENERAVTDCKSALVYNNNYSKAYCRLGVAYSNMGNFEKAEQAYAKAIELEPDNEVYKSNLEAARNARNQPPQMSRLRDDLTTMLSQPMVRNLFNNAEIDVEQLQSMIQNPMVMNTIGQQFAGGNVPNLPNDMVQMVHNIASHLAGMVPNPNANPGNEQQPGNQPPPST